MPEPCPRCKAIEVYQWRVPGGFVQSRCGQCNFFLSWVEKPVSRKKGAK